MLKSVKSKVIAGTVAFGLLSGVGVAFGSTDAGAQLKGWYDKQFSKSSDLVASEVASYGIGKVEGLTNEYNAIKDGTKKDLAKVGEQQTDTTNKLIDKDAARHIELIKGQKAHIESYLDSQFQALKDYSKGLINETGAEALAYATNDLKDHAGKTADAVKEKMNEDVKRSTDEAIRDLEETIAWAKSELQSELNKKTDSTIEEIKGMIDAKIADLRTQITNLNKALVKEHTRAITMAAKSLLLAAQKDLDAIVNGINK